VNLHDLHALHGEKTQWTISMPRIAVDAGGFGRKGPLFKYLTDPGFAPTVSARKISIFFTGRFRLLVHFSLS